MEIHLDLQASSPLFLECERKLGELYEAHFERMVKYATGITDDEQMARDIVQEVFTKLLGRSQIDPEDMLPKIHKGYVYASISFKIRDRFKHLTKVPHIRFTEALENGVAPEELQANSNTAEDARMLRERDAELIQALEDSGLKPNERQALRLHFLEGQDTNQIAEKLELSLRMIQHLLQVGKRKLRAILGENFLK